MSDNIIPKMFQCSICSSAFSFKINLLQHEKTHRLVKCDKCPAAFANRCHLNRHMRSAHQISPPDAGTSAAEEGSPVSCRICYKKFMNKSILSQHMWTHRQQFLQSGSLASSSTFEQLSTQAETSAVAGSSRISCKICPKTFINKANLNRHMLAHLKMSTLDCVLRCAHCPFKTPWKNSLEIHSEHHQKEYGLICRFCTYSCNKRKDMTNHMKLHDSQEPSKS